MYDISPTNVICMLVILLKYDETSPVYYTITNILITNMLNISIPKCHHLPSQNVHCRRLAGSPTRALLTAATWPRALLTFPPWDREELEQENHRWNPLRKTNKNGSLKVFSGKSWYECSQTGEIVISIVWLSPQLDMFTILWGSSHIVMDAYFPSVMIIRHGGSLYSG
jgi:hypothetical protein